MQPPEFVELSFSLPFYELYFTDIWEDNPDKRNPHELIEISKALDIQIDMNNLFEIYDNEKIGTGDIWFAFSQNSKEVFLFFDLFKDPIDQMAMIRFGIRILQKDYVKMKELLMELYLKSRPRSAFQEDYFNQPLYKISKSDDPLIDRNVNLFL